MRLCVCQFVSTLTAEQIDVQSHVCVCVIPSWQKDFWEKGLYMRGTWEVRECSGVFIAR